jgi:hypothetical protein
MRFHSQSLPANAPSSSLKQKSPEQLPWEVQGFACKPDTDKVRMIRVVANQVRRTLFVQDRFCSSAYGRNRLVVWKMPLTLNYLENP